MRAPSNWLKLPFRTCGLDSHVKQSSNRGLQLNGVDDGVLPSSNLSFLVALSRMRAPSNWVRLSFRTCGQDSHVKQSSNRGLQLNGVDDGVLPSSNLSFLVALSRMRAPSNWVRLSFRTCGQDSHVKQSSNRGLQLNVIDDGLLPSSNQSFLVALGCVHQ